MNWLGIVTWQITPHCAKLLTWLYCSSLSGSFSNILPFHYSFRRPLPTSLEFLINNLYYDCNPEEQKRLNLDRRFVLKSERTNKYAGEGNTDRRARKAIAALGLTVIAYIFWLLLGRWVLIRTRSSDLNWLWSECHLGHQNDRVWSMTCYLNSLRRGSIQSSYSFETDIYNFIA